MQKKRLCKFTRFECEECNKIFISFAIASDFGLLLISLIQNSLKQLWNTNYKDNTGQQQILNEDSI